LAGLRDDLDWIQAATGQRYPSLLPHHSAFSQALDAHVQRLRGLGQKPMQTQTSTRAEAWQRRREEYLRAAGRYSDLVKEGYL
jgi:hypothetical protein